MKTLKKLLSALLVAVMLMSAAPLSGIADFDWGSLFATKAAAEDEINETEIIDFEYLSAQLISGAVEYPNVEGHSANDIYNFYLDKDLFSPSLEMLSSIEADVGLQTALKLWELYCLGADPSTATGLVMDPIDYCETLLLATLKSTLEDSTIAKILKSSVINDSKELKSIFDSFCDVGDSLDFSADNQKIQSSLKKTIDKLYKDTKKDSSKASKIAGVVGDIVKYSNDIVELLQKIATYSAMLDLDDFSKQWLQEIKKMNQ